MHLIYLDESGNSGMNLNDPQQPVFVLCALILAEDHWQPLEADLHKILDDRFPNWRSIPDFEIHGADLRTGRGNFRGMSVADRIAFRDSWMRAGIKHEIRLIHRPIHKKLYANWLVSTFGQGV